ncbi:hypothetical protein M3Y99_00869700 [Aphelenchoides fujianensis]|nr:hypothetical protein M3Y99_00869700 [Aphelenchoides fujianensis]
MSDADDSKPAALPPTPSSTSSTATSSSKPLVLNGHDDSSTTSSGLGTAATTSTTPRTPRIRFDDESDLVAGTSSSSSATAPTMYPSGRRRVQFSPQSQVLIDESERLLQQRPSVGDFRSKRATASSSALESTVGDDDDEFGGVPGTSNYLLSPSRYRRSPLVPSASAAVLGDLATTPRYPLHTPAFPRIDMDDVRDEMVREKKPAWRELQESVKDSYRKASNCSNSSSHSFFLQPQRTAERHKDMNEFLDVNLSRRRARRSQSPFTTLNSEGFLPRAPSWFASGAMQPRGLGTSASMANIDTAGSGPYAAPALPRSKGIESRYDKMVDDVELRLLKTTLLPEYMKTVTKYEFRRGPQPSSGSVAEGILSDAEIAEFAPNPFYSRPSRRDPDYFDFDLEHSVNMCPRHQSGQSGEHRTESADRQQVQHLQSPDFEGLSDPED